MLNFLNIECSASYPNQFQSSPATENQELRSGIDKRVENVKNEQSLPFSKYYSTLFPQNALRVLYIELDPGVDDSTALLQLLAARKSARVKEGKKIEIAGIVPCVGNAVLAQTQQNTLELLELADSQDIKVYPGAIAPLAIENDPDAINAMNQSINKIHFYGHDGEEDVGAWPKVTMKLQPIPGYKFAATLISNASPETAVTLVSTSALTELAKTLTELENLDSLKGLPPGSFAKKINAISMMGGCIDHKLGNAPFNVPDNQKIAEANFYFDTPATQKVFAICQKYGIPILLAPLDLTEATGLLWTKKQVSMLNQMDNAVARQMAKVTNVVPYIDARHFPKERYPMHDLQAVTDFLFPDFYTVTRLSVKIGDVGQIIVNSSATEEQKNVYVLEMPTDKQTDFYQTVLSEYHQFDK